MAVQVTRCRLAGSTETTDYGSSSAVPVVLRPQVGTDQTGLCWYWTTRDSDWVMLGVDDDRMATLGIDPDGVPGGPIIIDGDYPLMHVRTGGHAVDARRGVGVAVAVRASVSRIRGRSTTGFGSDGHDGVRVRAATGTVVGGAGVAALRPANRGGDVRRGGGGRLGRRIDHDGAGCGVRAVDRLAGRFVRSRVRRRRRAPCRAAPAVIRHSWRTN
jgi:hypothetical protein